MQSLVLENIFEEVNVTDYQSVCYMYTNEGNPANILQTVCIWFDKIRGENSGSIEMWFIDLSLQPFLYIWKLIKLTIKLIAWAIIQTSLLPVDANDVTPEYDGIFKLRKLTDDFHFCNCVNLSHFRLPFPTDYQSSTMPPFQIGDEKIKTLNKSAIINRTRLYSCDKTIKLYTLSPSIRNRSNNNRAHSCDR